MSEGKTDKCRRPNLLCLSKETIGLIKETSTITAKQMSETLSVRQHSIERDLSSLQKTGVLSVKVRIMMDKHKELKH